MPGKSKRTIWIAAIILLVILIAACVSMPQKSAGAERHKSGIFAWHWDALNPDSRDGILQLLISHNIRELYQYVPRDTDDGITEGLVRAAEEAGIQVYLLTGEPEWALERDAEHVRQELLRAKLYGFSGLVVDVEPYLLPEWKTSRNEVFQSYVDGLCRAKKQANEQGLELILCIPYYWDEQLDSELYEMLIDEGCDTLAVMNYYRKNEAEHIRKEAALCSKYRKALIQIYELQRPGTSGLKEVNTYYGDALALRESWAALSQEFQKQAFSCALHELRSWKEMLAIE